MAASKGAVAAVMAVLVLAAMAAGPACASSAGGRRFLDQVPGVDCALPFTDCKEKSCCFGEDFGCAWTGLKDSGVPLIAYCHPLSTCNAARTNLCNVNGLGSLFRKQP